MAAAVTLRQAAQEALDNLYTKWAANTVRTNVINFVAAIQATFPDDNEKSRPVGNWLIPLRGYVEPLPVGATAGMTLAELNQIAQYVYRACWLGFQLNQGASPRVTNAQALAMLNAYNANF